MSHVEQTAIAQAVADELIRRGQAAQATVTTLSLRDAAEAKLEERRAIALAVVELLGETREARCMLGFTADEAEGMKSLCRFVTRMGKLGTIGVTLAFSAIVLGLIGFIGWALWQGIRIRLGVR